MGKGQYFRKPPIYLILLTFLSLFLFILLRSSRTDFQERSYSSIQNSVYESSQDVRPNWELSRQDELYDIVKKITAGNNHVLVTLINRAFLPFTLSWLCNTKFMGIHNQTLFLTTDEESKEVLSKLWPEVSAFNIGVGKERDQTYSHTGYVRLMVHRTQILMKILEMNREIFLFEVDCFWVKNPLPELKKNRDVDILVTPVSQRAGIIAGGFLYLFPTVAAVSTWRELTNKMTRLGEKIKTWKDDKPVPESENDQMYLSELVKNRHAGIRVRQLPANVFPDGKWYEYSKEKRQATQPLIINNNWIVGNYRKIKRAKEWKHWFLENDDATCVGDIRTTNEHLL